MNKLIKNRNSKGFTIIELLVATAVFSVVLVVFLSAFIRISELFYKGINLSNTQEAARNAVQSVSNDIQFYHAAPFVDATNQYFCVGSHRYTYSLGTQYVPGSTFGLLKENISNCSPPSSQAPNVNTGQELLNPGMQLNALNLACNNNVCTISIHMVFYGSDPTVLIPNSHDPNAQCSGAINSSQYCATADFKSTVLQSF